MKCRPFLVILLSLASSPLHAVFDSHFFHAAYFWNEPRLIRPLLQTYSADISGDTTMLSRNSNGCLVPLFDLYGAHDMRVLGRNVAGLDPVNQLDRILLDLATLPPRDCFGDVSFSGLFKMMRFDFKFYQNLACGFFIGLELPVFEFTIAPAQPIDLSPHGNTMPNAQTPVWRSFLRSFDPILERFNLDTSPMLTTDLGDTIIVAGYGINYDEHWYLDLIDVTVMLAGLIPTGRQANPDKPFDVPNGYNGHFGVGLSGDAAIGLWDWVTLGAHTECLFLLTNDRDIRIKTTREQQGLIKLTKTHARIDPGNLWRFGPYFKADHVLGGLSLLFGYSYEQKNRAIITRCSTACDLGIVNSDSTLAGFSQHTFHLIVEYDASHDDSDIGPRVAFFLNHSIFGKRIFDTTIKGGFLGIDVTWNF